MYMFNVELSSKIAWRIGQKDPHLSSDICINNSKLRIINPIIYNKIETSSNLQLSLNIFEDEDLLIYSNFIIFQTDDYNFIKNINTYYQFFDELEHLLQIFKYHSKQYFLPTNITSYSGQLKNLLLPSLPVKYTRVPGKDLAYNKPIDTMALRFDKMDIINQLYIEGGPEPGRLIFFDAICAYYKNDFIKSNLYCGFAIEIFLLDRLAAHNSIESNSIISRRRGMKFNDYFNQATKCLLGNALHTIDGRLDQEIKQLYDNRGSFAHKGYKYKENHFYSENRKKAEKSIELVSRFISLFITDEEFIVPLYRRVVVSKVEIIC